MENTIINYLKDLQNNNNREWFHSHKKEYQNATQQFETMLSRLIMELGKTDPGILRYTPKELTFKLVRDTRFSHDKSPYLPAFRCHISPAGKVPIPVGYYLFIRPGNQSFLGGGLFADRFKDATLKMRDYLAAHGEEWEELITAQDFTERFTVKGNALKNVPRGYDRSHPQAEYLKNKSWYIEYPFEDHKLNDLDAFVDFAVPIFLKMRPWNHFLNCAFEGFEMPKR